MHRQALAQLLMSTFHILIQSYSYNLFVISVFAVYSIIYSHYTVKIFYYLCDLSITVHSDFAFTFNVVVTTRTETQKSVELIIFHSVETF